jgi:hypothetical protein
MSTRYLGSSVLVFSELGFGCMDRNLVYGETTRVPHRSTDAHAAEPCDVRSLDCGELCVLGIVAGRQGFILISWNGVISDVSLRYQKNFTLPAQQSDCI